MRRMGSDKNINKFQLFFNLFFLCYRVLPPPRVHSGKSIEWLGKWWWWWSTQGWPAQRQGGPPQQRVGWSQGEWWPTSVTHIHHHHLMTVDHATSKAYANPVYRSLDSWLWNNCHPPLNFVCSCTHSLNRPTDGPIFFSLSEKHPSSLRSPMPDSYAPFPSSFVNALLFLHHSIGYICVIKYISYILFCPDQKETKPKSIRFDRFHRPWINTNWWECTLALPSPPPPPRNLTYTTNKQMAMFAPCLHSLIHSPFQSHPNSLTHLANLLEKVKQKQPTNHSPCLEHPNHIITVINNNICTPVLQALPPSFEFGTLYFGHGTQPMFPLFFRWSVQGIHTHTKIGMNVLDDCNDDDDVCHWPFAKGNGNEIKLYEFVYSFAHSKRALVDLIPPGAHASRRKVVRTLGCVVVVFVWIQFVLFENVCLSVPHLPPREWRVSVHPLSTRSKRI